jgi:ABC-type molybdate transport system substrate-binding protein
VGNAIALAKGGRAAPPVVFTRNRLCALIAPGVEVTPETLLDRMLDPSVKLGTSTPRADPAGDYTWRLFDKADKLRPGAYAALDRKALQLTGGRIPRRRRRTGRTMDGARRPQGGHLPHVLHERDAGGPRGPGRTHAGHSEALAVGASYGLTVLEGARPAAQRFALFIVSIPAQEVFVRHGFTPIGMP